MTILLLLQGGGDSIIDAKKCDNIDWTIFIILLIICFIFLAIGIFVNKKEYKEKVKYKYKFVPGDFEATPKNILALSAISFGGAFLASFSGAEAGTVFIPIMLMIGMQP